MGVLGTDFGYPKGVPFGGREPPSSVLNHWLRCELPTILMPSPMQPYTVIPRIYVSTNNCTLISRQPYRNKSDRATCMAVVAVWAPVIGVQDMNEAALCRAAAVAAAAVAHSK